jgi:hypothetical protein
MSFIIGKAIRTKVKLRVALIGPSGSGKTYSALTLAKGIGGRVALLDTEARRALYYADKFEFDHCDFPEPYTPERYIEAIAQIAAAGYETCIIDSASHEWMGKGGCLDILNVIGKQERNEFAAWAKVTPRHNAFVDALVRAPMHLIICLRGKDEYVLEANDRGKQIPRKVGVGAQTRKDGLEYECTAALLIDVADHCFTVTKDNTSVFEGRSAILTALDGQKLKAWADSGVVAPDLPPVAPPVKAEPVAPNAPVTASFTVGKRVQDRRSGNIGTVVALPEGRTVKPGMVPVEYDDGTKAAVAQQHLDFYDDMAAAGVTDES